MEGHQILEAGGLALWKETEGSGLVQLGEKTAGGDLMAALVPMEKSVGDGARAFTWGMVGG